jgi:hypothetical protein
MAIMVYRYAQNDQDHSDGMIAFFTELIGVTRVRLADSEAMALDPRSRYSVFQMMYKLNSLCWLAPYNMGTYFLREQFANKGLASGNQKQKSDNIRKAFSVDNYLGNKAIQSFLESKLGCSLDNFAKRRILVLWSRFTGKKGEYHPEHDTSFHGIAQMAWMAAELGYYVIIAGDKPILHENVINQFQRKRRFDEIVAEIDHYYGEMRCYNLTEFWTEPQWKFLSSGKRMMQFKIYELLHLNCDVRHLGMRSGNLEALALLGYFVRYMEEEKSYGGERMVAWHGTSIGYERILLHEPPTRVGKFIHHKVKAKASQASVPPYISNRNRGFANTATRSQSGQEERLRVFDNSVNATSSNISDPVKKGTFMQTKLGERSELLKSLQEENEKPEEVKNFENGFVTEDLIKIRAFLVEDNLRLTSDRHLPIDSKQTGNDGRIAEIFRVVVASTVKS